MTFLTIQLESSHSNIIGMVDKLMGDLVQMHADNNETVGIDVFDTPDHVVSQWGND